MNLIIYIIIAPERIPRPSKRAVSPSKGAFSSHMIIKMADDAKCFAALLNGLSKQVYFRNTELTDNVLKEQIYPDLSEDDFNRLKTKTTGLLKVIKNISWNDQT